MSDNTEEKHDFIVTLTAIAAVTIMVLGCLWVIYQIAVAA